MLDKALQCACVVVSMCAIAFASRRDCFAQESEAIQILESAARNCGESVIVTAEVHFVAKIRDAPHTRERLAEIIANQKASLKEVIRTSDNPLLVKQLENALVDFDENVATQLRNNVNRRIEGVYFVDGPEQGGDRLEPVSKLLFRDFLASKLHAVCCERRTTHGYDPVDVAATPAAQQDRFQDGSATILR